MYFLDMEEEKLLGSILLPSYKISPCLNDDGLAKKFAFKAEHNNMKTYYFAADSKESMTQWMNSLSLASIMQLSSAFSTVRNQGDGQEVGNNEDEEESGFTSYQSRRTGSVAMNSSYDTNIGSGDKYPGSYNSVGLPIVYQQVQRPIQRSQHYVNAPPKPKRQFYDNSDLYVIPPSAQYHQHLQPTQQATPDLIAHDSYNSNYLPSCYYPQSYSSVPSYDQQNSPQYRIQQTSGNYSRLPPRPHSADFLERDQEEEEYQKMVPQPAYNTSAQPPDVFYPPSPEAPKIMPVRPKSSLERYDSYYSRYYYDQTNFSPPVHSNVTPKEPRPWSDYLSSANSITSPRDEPRTAFPSLTTSHYHTSANTNNYTTERPEQPRNYQREESLQRLLEWKQRMLQSPLNKRNWQQQHQTSKSELPSRPPLPEEYRSKFAIKDALKEAQYHQKARSKSVGDGNEFISLSNGDGSQKDPPISYSSDDEGKCK